MSHLNSLRLPEGIAVGAAYGPEFVTEIKQVQGGQEKRNRVRTYPLCVGDLAMSPRIKADYAEVLAHFRVANGRLHTWRFPDMTDFECLLDDGVGQLTDQSTYLQLIKIYPSDAGWTYTTTRNIQQPIAATFNLYDDEGATLLTAGSDYTLDDALGRLTLATTRTVANLRWSGEFDNAVRYDTDRMATSIDAFEVFSWGGIPIKEVVLK